MKTKTLAAIAGLACACALHGIPLAQTAAVQTQPDDGSPVITILKAGTEPVPAAVGVPVPDGWMAVSVPGPFDGYVLNSDLTKQLDVKPGAPIRLEPKPDAGILTLGEKDDKSRITGLHGAWTQIRIEKPLVGYVRIGGVAAAPAAPPVAPAPIPPRDLAAPPGPAPSTAPAASAVPAASPAASAGDAGPVSLGRPFEGKLASTRRPFMPRRPYDWELIDGSGHRFAYLDISRLLQTDQIGSYSDREVVVFGALKPVPGGKDPVIEVENLRLK